MDVWSVGVLTYELIFGRSPFNGKDHEDTFAKVLKVFLYLICIVYVMFKGDIRFSGPISFECGDFISKILVKEP